MKSYRIKPTLVEPSDCILNMFSVMDLPLILFKTTCGIYSVPNESDNTAEFLPIINETQSVSLICLT